MLALAYLVLMTVFGDAVARPFFPGAARLQRLATAFLVGLLVATWLTYLSALAFAGVEQPLIPGDAIATWFMAVVIAVRFLPAWTERRRLAAQRVERGAGDVEADAFEESARVLGADPRQSERWDWVLAGLITAFVSWLMVWTFNVSGGRLQIGTHLWSDFGPTTAIAQSFALGHNFPTQYPHFTGLPILYHFLFYFQVGNLTFLGLDPATANNILSVGSVTAMLILVMALGRKVFHSAAVGRLAAILFFFHGALSFVPYLASFASPADALAAIGKLDQYLSSGFPYRGDDWGVWTQNVFLNQRHLASAVGILLLVLLFVVERLQARPVAARPAAELGEMAETADSPETPDPPTWQVPAAGLARVARDRLADPGGHIRAGLRDPLLRGYVLCGVLLGLLPLWNSAIFVASAALFAVVFVLFPNRAQMVVMALAAAVPALPQILALRAPSFPGSQSFPVFHWGYTVDPPTVLNVVVYLGFIFGPKLVLAAIALVAGNSFQRRLFVAAATLVAIAFLVQFSLEVFANHKFLNVWLIILNLFAAYGIVTLWLPQPPGSSPLAGLPARVVGRVIAVLLVLVIAIGGAIDLVPIAREQRLSFPLAGDRLFDWVAGQTRRTDVFLTDRYVTHPILLAGRPIFFGWPYYAWSTGYDVATREAIYGRMLQSENPQEVLQLLQDNNIAYVAIDDGLRQGNTVTRLNEDIYRANFQMVFDDPEGVYGHLAIYRVPARTGAPTPGTPTGSPTPSALASRPPATPSPSTGNLFVAGQPVEAWRALAPRGLAVAPDGSILVADTGNHRIDRFAADGSFLRSFGSAGNGPGQFTDPNGVAVDSRGHVFVADTGNHRLEEFDAQDAFVREWKGPAPGFYGPRDVTVGPDDTVYVLDQGHARVVRVPATGDVTTFGSFGNGPGQLNDPTGVAASRTLVFLADSANLRVQVFGIDGGFVRSIAVPEWGTPPRYPDVAVSADGRFVLVSSPATNEVIVFTTDGNRVGTLKSTTAEALVGPSALAVRPDGSVLVVDFDAARISELAAPGP